MSAHTDLTHDQICQALYALGATRLTWQAGPEHDEDGYLEIEGLRLENAAGDVVGWFAQVCEDGAYDLADAISDEPGSYVLNLPAGEWSHVVTGYRDPEDPRYWRCEGDPESGWAFSGVVISRAMMGETTP